MRYNDTRFDQQRRHGGGLPGRQAGRRRGNTLLEVQVAFAILGIGLAGLSRLVVMQIRQVRVLENRLQGKVVQYNPASGTSVPMLPGHTYYLVPWQNLWTRKLSGASQIVTESSTIPGDLPGAPVFQLSGQATPTYAVTIQNLNAADNDQAVTATVQLTAP